MVTGRFKIGGTLSRYAGRPIVFYFCSRKRAVMEGYMKHKNILLVAFFLSLFVFQQVQAGAVAPIAKNPAQINPAPANAGILYTNLYIYVYILQGNGAIQQPPTLCKWPDKRHPYGCRNTPPT